tara:strand:+ start:235 stop:399 length:165 start_codon:yes stop_codon:yes gene_type:complete
MNETFIIKKLQQEAKAILLTAKRSNDLELMKRAKAIQKLSQELLVMVREKNEKN